ncbi:MAG: hypothetical protein RLZZ241_1228 [Bacteroidota bacterium]
MALQAGLKGGDYNALLTSEILEDIRIKPFYNREDLPQGAPLNYSLPDSWKIGTFISASGVGVSLNESHPKDLGIDRWVLHLPETPTDIPEWLVNNAKCPDSIQIIPANPYTFTFKKLPNAVVGTTEVLLDPIGKLVLTGNWIKNKQADLDLLPEIAHKIAAAGLNPRLLIQVATYQHAGANAVQEIAYALAQAYEYLNLATEKSIGFEWLQEPIFQVALGGEYFTDIAKIRALRHAWALLAQTLEQPTACQIQVQPSSRNKTKFDFNTNLIRTTMECAAGISGGANCIFNLPYDVSFKDSNPFSQRLALNQLLILRHEAGLGQANNPAAGAFYLESLTNQLGKKAVALFKSIVQGGGLIAQLKSHTLQKKIRASANKEQELFNTGQRVLVGSNFQPDLREAAVLGSQLSTSRNAKRKTEIEPVVLRRLAEQYELNRMQHVSR